jgi:hypothetical protein
MRGSASDTAPTDAANAFLGLRESLCRRGNAEHRIALDNGAPEQSMRQRRCHHCVDAERPADWPKIVTLSESPPKPLTLFRAQRRAAIISSGP